MVEQRRKREREGKGGRIYNLPEKNEALWDFLKVAPLCSGAGGGGAGGVRGGRGVKTRPLHTVTRSRRGPICQIISCCPAQRFYLQEFHRGRIEEYVSLLCGVMGTSSLTGGP